MYNNQSSSPDFEEFLEVLGEKIPLKGWEGKKGKKRGGGGRKGKKGGWDTFINWLFYLYFCRFSRRVGCEE